MEVFPDTPARRLPVDYAARTLVTLPLADLLAWERGRKVKRTSVLSHPSTAAA